MPTIFDPWADEAIESKPKSNIFDPWSVEEEKPSGLLRRGIGDPLVSAAKGLVVGLPEAAVGIADIPTLGYAGKAVDIGMKAATGLVADKGFGLKESGEFFDKFLSPEAKEAQRKVSEAKGAWNTVKTALENPSFIANLTAEMLPQMAGGAKIGQMALSSVGKSVFAKGITAAERTRRGILAAGVGEGAITAGQIAESIRQENESGTITAKQAALSAGAGAITGVIGVYGGKLAQKLGFEDIDLMFQNVRAETGEKGAMAVAKKIIGSAISEGVLQELPQSLQEQMAQNWATGKPIMEGVPEAGAIGAVAGGFMGGGATVYGYVRPQTAVAKVLLNDPLANEINTQLSQADPEGVTNVPAEAWDTSAVPVRQPSQEPAPSPPVQPATETNVATATLTPEEVAVRDMQRGNVAAEEAKAKQATAQSVLETTAKKAEAQKGFASEAEALMSIQARKLDPKDFNINKVGNRWTLTPKSIYEGLDETKGGEPSFSRNKDATALRNEGFVPADKVMAADLETGDKVKIDGEVYESKGVINGKTVLKDGITLRVAPEDDIKIDALKRGEPVTPPTEAERQKIQQVAEENGGRLEKGWSPDMGYTVTEIRDGTKKSYQIRAPEEIAPRFAEARKPGSETTGLPKQIVKVKDFKTGEGNFTQYAFNGERQQGEVVVQKGKDGFTIRNILLPEGERRKGIASRTYLTLNEQSLKETGKPLMSTKPRTLSDGTKIHELTKEAKAVWDKFVSQGKAVENTDGSYRFSTTPTTTVSTKETIGEAPTGEIIPKKGLGEAPGFVKGAPGKATKENVQMIADNLTRGLKNAFPINVMTNVKDSNMPSAAWDAMFNANVIDPFGTSDVAGMVWRGETYLFADNLSGDFDAIRTVVKHEMFHNGFQVLFTKLSNKSQTFMPYLKNVNAYLDKVWTDRQAEVRANAVENQSQLSIDDKSESTRTKARRKAAEEWLANQAPESEPKLFDRLVSIVRDFLRQIGFDTKLSDAEVRTIIADSYAALRDGVSTDIKNSRPVFTFGAKNTLGKISNHARSLGSRVLAGLENPNIRIGKLKTDIASYFAKMSSKNGVIGYRKNDPKENRKAEKYLREFFDVCMAKHPEALQWYRGDLKETFDILNQIAPELAKKENRFVMNLALAITSDGNNNIDNVRLGHEVYENWKKNGTLQTQVEARRGTQIRDGLKRADGLRQAFNSLGEYETWLLGKVPRGVLIDEVSALLGITREEASFVGNGESIDTILPRSVIFGPKLGGAFYPNLSGDFDTVTIDQWFMRTIGRITGDLVEGGTPEAVDAQREGLRNAAKESPEGIKMIRKLGGEQLLINASEEEKLDILATTIAKLSKDESFRKKLDAVKGGIALRTAANNRNLYSKGALPKDAPDGPGHRTWLRDRVNNIRKGLAKEGKNYDNADIQAVMWIGEKELWKKYGIRQTEGDYYSAGANALYEGIHGRPSELFTGGARRVGEAGRASMEQGALFSRQKQERSKTERAYGIIGQIKKVAQSNPKGFTINISDGTTQKTGYAVSPSKLTETRLDVLTEDDLLGFLNKFEAVFNTDDRAFLGGWFDSETKKFVLDVSFVVDNIEEALYLGENGGQDAIFDITKQDEIRTADGISDLKQRNVYSESKRDALRGVQESLRQTIQGSGLAEGKGADGRTRTGTAEKNDTGNGRVPAGAVSTLEGIHYSNRYRDFISSEFAGTGLKGAENRRLEGNPDLQQRINLYYNSGAGINKEPGLGNYAHRIPATYNFYDAIKDPLGLAKNSPDVNAFERAVMSNGYDGYSNSKRGAAVLLGKRNIKVRPTTKATTSKTTEEPSFSRSGEQTLAQSASNYYEAARSAWQTPNEGYKYPGAIKRAFEYVFGSPEHSAHPVIKALSRVFEERNGWFNEYFLRFAEGDHPGRQHDTMAEALDSLNDDHYDSFEQIDNDMDVSGFTQDEAREYMKKNKVAPEVVEAWEAKTARFNTVMDTIIDSVQEQVGEIDESASMRGAEPSYPRIAYETNAQGEPDTNSPIDLKDYIDVLKEMKNYAYSPRIREPGKYVVRAEISASGRKFMQFAKSQIAAEKLKIDKMREGWENVEVAQSRTLPESVQAGLKEVDVLKLVGEALNKTNDAAASEAFGAQLTSAIHNIILSRGYRRHQIGRQLQLVEGYETDPRKKVFTYLTNSAAGIAKAKAAKNAMQIMTGGTKQDTAEGAQTVKTLGEYHETPINPAMEGKTYEAAKKYIADNLRNIEDADRAVAFVKKLATFKYLSWTLRAPLVNVTALMTTVTPSLQEYAGQGKVGIANVLKEVGRASGHYIRVMRGERGTLTASEQAFMDEINRRQYDDPQMVRDMMTSMQGSSGRTFDNIVQWGMKPFSYVEQWMRGLTMLAGYRIAKQGGMSELDAREAAIKSASNAHGVYGKATRQYWAQGTDPAARIGQVASTFLKFPQNYLNLLYDLGYTKKNIKAFTWALAAPIVLGGMASIPFKDNIVWMINALLKGLGDDRDIEKMVFDDARHYLGAEAEKNLRTGVMGWAGIDITGSLAMNIGVPTDLLSLTGIFGAMAKETYRAGHFISTQQYSKALETVLPSLPANALRAFREMDGATTMSGKRVWNEDGTPYMPTSAETAMRIAGFRGSKRTTTQQRDWETQREKQRWDESKGKIYERYRAYLSERNPSPDKFKSIMEDVFKYNKAIVARGRVGMVVPIRPGQLKKITRDMLRQSKTELRMQKVGR